jgi:hypothetical protein
MKTAELTGAALDWAVAKIEANVWGYFSPSTNWAHGGPIIEREKIKLDPRRGQWEATIWNEATTQNPAFGPTPLIAAMRCFVASKLGDEVEIPKELTE